MSEDAEPDTIARIMEFLNDRHLACKLIFGVKKDGKLTLSHMDLDKKAIEAYREIFQRKVKKRKKMNHAEYNSADYDPKEYMTINVSDVPKAKQVLKDSDNQILKLTKEFIANVEFTVFRLQNSDLETSYFIRSYWRVELLAQDKVKALIVREGILSLADKDLIIGTPTFEVIGFGTQLLIFSKSAFEKIFEYTESYLKQGKEVFDYLKQRIGYEIDGLAEIEAGCNQLEDLRRLSSIRSSDSYRKTTFEKLVEFAERNGELGILVKKEKRKVQFPDVGKFLMAYNEDYHEGPLSGRKFIIFRKKLSKL